MSTPHTLPASTGTALLLPKTHTLKITNTHGSQVVDLWALNPSAPATEYLSMAHNHAIHRRINFLTKPTTTANQNTTANNNNVVLYSSTSRPMLSLREDTSAGDHDTLIAACNPLRYERMGVQGWHASCAGNYQEALKDFLASSNTTTNPSKIDNEDSSDKTPFPFPTTPPPPLNLFMNVKVDEGGGIVFRAPTSGAGDFVVLEALMDVVVVMSACPMDRRASGDWVPVPREVGYEVWGG